MLGFNNIKNNIFINNFWIQIYYPVNLDVILGYKDKIKVDDVDFN